MKIDTLYRFFFLYKRWYCVVDGISFDTIMRPSCSLFRRFFRKSITIVPGPGKAFGGAYRIRYYIGLCELASISGLCAQISCVTRDVLYNNIIILLFYNNTYTFWCVYYRTATRHRIYKCITVVGPVTKDSGEYCLPKHCLLYYITAPKIGNSIYYYIVQYSSTVENV